MKCPFNGLVKCSDDCMALDKTEFGHRSCKLVDMSEHVEDLSAAVHGLDKTLFDTLGSSKTGDALDSVARLDDAIGIVANEIGEIADAMRGEGEGE